MSRTRALLLLVLALAAIAWAYESGAPARSLAARPPHAAASRPAPQVFDLEVRADRLDGRASSTTRPDARRNPFRFGESLRASSTPQPARPMDAAAAAIVAPPVPVLPPLELSGVADRTVGDKPVRIAIIAAGESLVFASVGDRVGSRYEVIAIAADSVDLRDLTDGSTRKLTLK